MRIYPIDCPALQAPPATDAHRKAALEKLRQRRITAAPIAANKVVNSSAAVLSSEGLTRRPTAAVAVSTTAAAMASVGKNEGGSVASSLSTSVSSSSNVKDE